MDELLKGYRPTEPFRVAGGGQCEWTIAEKGGRPYFIKKFLHPKFPVEGSPGSSQTKERQRHQCEIFESHQRSVMKALHPLVGSGGNLVVPTDFFRVGTTYYKAADWVTANVAPEAVAEIPLQARIIVLLTLSASLRILHGENLVHGDIKPANILLTQTGERYISKLIDFDDCFRPGSVPDPESLVGDFKYYSPELGEYISSDDGGEKLAVALTTKSDIYALGLVFHQFITGKTVALPGLYKTSWQASLDGQRLELAMDVSPRLEDLIKNMLEREPSKRPSAGEVFDRLKDVQRDLRSGSSPSPSFTRTSRPEAARPIVAPHRDDPGDVVPKTSPGSSRLKINMSRSSTPLSSSEESADGRIVEPTAGMIPRPRLTMKGLHRMPVDEEGPGGS
ncbi:serine/threonine protein kinase [Arthrobacter mobilis]|uniref:non-specific serine/threonine protein kinase n=1 Tax=Arthrobacter mobilis TaxID=2724944 RepID=A0A7X6K6J8_9MICC|nr:protein kinase [Arthrobacter mobilis]NKX55944.1 protein kinase [Arthrobacter mobilis]